eukprot:TRINITY_DN28790_c0_g1_i2.p1 TRINITY_DN28790_c0_g1~~TRINITY_DN28790_c0_g1_i2.p1  ORF type:complete len:810 (+),score=85.50 TRINITY_DN28790_c0_g1_i2:40-2469(+)
MRPLSFLVLGYISFIGTQCGRKEEDSAQSLNVIEHSDLEQAASVNDSQLSTAGFHGYREQDRVYVQEKYKNFLLDDEEVMYAWKHVFSYFFLTDRRVVFVKCAGAQSKVTSTEVLYTTYAYNHILRFSVTTKGARGTDITASITFWTRRDEVKTELMWNAAKEASLFEVSKFLSMKLIRERASVSAPLDLKSVTQTGNKGSNATSTNVAFRVFDKMVLADPVQVENELKNKTADVGPVLLEDENVQIAYKGFVDLLVFTDKRVVLRDKEFRFLQSQAPSQYTSFSYANVVQFSVKSAGWVDADSEIMIYTQKNKYKLDLSRKEDLLSLYKVLSKYVLPGKTKIIEATSSLMSIKQGVTRAPLPTLSNIILGGSLLKPEDLQNELSKVLMPQETVQLGIKSIRDKFIVTSDRILNYDVQGFTGAEKEYTTYLPETVTELEIFQAGNEGIDLDGEMVMRFEDGHTKSLKLRRDADIIGVGREVARLMVETQDEVLAEADDDSSESSIFNGFFGGFNGDKEQIENDLRNVNALYEGEKVHAILNIAGERAKLLVLASKRMLAVGTADELSPRLWFRSIPYHCILSFRTYALPGTQVGVPPGRAAQTHIHLSTGSGRKHEFTLAFGGTADLPRFSRMLASRILKRYESRANRINEMIGAETWASELEPASWFGAEFGGFIGKKTEIQNTLSTPPFQLLFTGEQVIVAYSFSQTVFRMQVVLTQWRVIVIQPHEDETLLINSVPYDSVDAFMVDPGNNPITLKIRGIDQKYGGSIGQFIISSTTGTIIDTKVRYGQNVLGFAKFLAKFTFLRLD